MISCSRRQYHPALRRQSGGFLGIGKSGHIGKKIAATLASTGTMAFFVHPAEALHGDLGMIESRDVMLFISYSGGAKELISLFRVWKTNLSRCWQ